MNKYVIAAGLLLASSVCRAESLPEGLRAAPGIPAYAGGQSTVEQDMEFLRRAVEDYESAKAGYESTRSAYEAARTARAVSADAEDSTDAELQESYFEDLYGRVKEKAELRRVDREALSLAKGFEQAKNAPGPALNANGAVTHVFGSTIPKILCRPLRVTDIQLQPGETVTDAPAIGDSVNWTVTPASSGSGGNLTVHILIKPAMPDLMTNLIVHTDRRTYVMDLVSDRKNHTPLVAFTYPEWENRESWDSFTGMLRNKTAAAVRNTRQSQKGAVVLNSNYKLRGKRYSWYPVEVVDDGMKTYITFPDTVAAAEFPVFMVTRGKNKEIVNYRVQGQTMIIDRIFKTGMLRIGTGTGAETVYITRTSFKAERVAEDEREFSKKYGI